MKHTTVIVCTHCLKFEFSCHLPLDVDIYMFRMILIIKGCYFLSATTYNIFREVGLEILIIN
jgi:hypothetical protein